MKVSEFKEGKLYRLKYPAGIIDRVHIEFTIKSGFLYEIMDSGTEHTKLSSLTFNDAMNGVFTEVKNIKIKKLIRRLSMKAWEMEEGKRYEFMEVKRIKKVDYYEALRWMHNNLMRVATLNGEEFLAYRTLGFVLIGKDENGSFNKYDATKEMIEGIWEIPID